MLAGRLRERKQGSSLDKGVNLGNGRLTGHRPKGARTFFPHSADGLQAGLNDKEGSSELRQGVAEMKCMGSRWSLWCVPEANHPALGRNLLWCLLIMFHSSCIFISNQNK